MKRILSLSFLFFALSMALHAQLPRNFYGATLGVSTKQQTIKALLAQKVCIALNTEDGLLVRNVTLEGQQFDNLQMVFYDDILSKIYFNDDDDDDDEKAETIADRYTSKFSKYKYHFLVEENLFDDDVTKVMISGGAVYFIDMKMLDREERDRQKYYREIHPYTEPRISATVLGCTLGTSTKQQVMATLKSKGLSVLPFDTGDGGATVVFEGTYHEGESFDYIYAQFCDGKLANLSFVMLNDNLSDYQINSLVQHFNGSYRAYNKNEELDLDGSEGYLFDDDRISIAIAPQALIYGHKELQKKISRKNERSLRGVE